MVEKVKAVKRWALALILVATYCWGGLYLACGGALNPETWFSGVGALAGAAVAFYFQTRREERREEAER